MAGLRTILLLIGAALVAGVWWWSTRRAPQGEAVRPRVEPKLGDRVGDPEPPTEHADVTTPRNAEARATARAVAADAAAAAGALLPPSSLPEARVELGEPGPGFDPARDMILSLFVVPAAGETFLGAEVVETLGAAGLRFGKRQVFHRQSPDGRSMYCVANMVEPGTLAPDAIRFEHVPGLLFFAVLPGPRSGTDTFADMIATARRVAQRLRGELADAERSSLTPQTIQHLRERVVEFERLRERAEG